MAQRTKVRLASLSIVVLLGGLAVLGLATRPDPSETVAGTPASAASELSPAPAASSDSPDASAVSAYDDEDQSDDEESDDEEGD